jgi:RNA polymerase sigma factor (sigma-70 family)
MSHSSSVLNVPLPMGLADALARMALNADRGAWEVIVRDAGPHLWRIARRISCDQDAADDAMQEALLQVRDHANSFRDPGKDSDRAALRWLMGIAVHAVSAIHRRRNRRREQPLVDAMGLAAPPRPVDSMTSAEALNEAGARQRLLHDELRMLPVSLREPVLMHYISGLPMSEVAATLGITLGNAKVRVHRGLRRLRRRLGAGRPLLSLVQVGGLLHRLPSEPVLAAHRFMSLLRSPQVSTLGLPMGSRLLEMSMIAKCTMLAVLVCAVGVIPLLSGQEAPAHPAQASVKTDASLAVVSVDPSATPQELMRLSNTLAQHVTLLYDGTAGRHPVAVGEILQALFAFGGMSYVVTADVLPQELLTMHLVDATIGNALATISKISHLRFAYSRSIITVSHDATSSGPGGDAVAAAVKALPYLSAVVAAVRDDPAGAQDLVILTIDKNAQVVQGTEFIIYRDNQYICIVRSERDFKGMAMCRVVPGSWNTNHLHIAMGDIATNRITKTTASESAGPTPGAAGASF